MDKEVYKLYDDEIELHFDPQSHIYTVDGKKVTGVTGATGIINKPALIYWAVNQAVESLQGRLEPDKKYDELEIRDMLETAKTAHRKFSKDAADIGTMIHEWIEKWIKGDKPKLPTNEILHKAVSSFMGWAKKSKAEFIHTERKVYSKKYNYAGTCDFVAKIDGKYVVGDIKTSSGFYPEMFFQVAAYQQALKEELDLKFSSNVIVRCGKDGALEIKETKEFKENFGAFLGALNLYNRLQNIKDQEVAKLL